MGFKVGDICIRENGCLVEITSIATIHIYYKFLNTRRVGSTDCIRISFFNRLHTLASPSAIVLYGNSPK